VGDEVAVYSGPVPAQHFPLDLTLMLGKGSRERSIVLVPLASQSHWNTFLYIDAGSADDEVLAAVEILARYAVSRMTLLQVDQPRARGRVREILDTELARRRRAGEQDAGSADVSPADADRAAPESKAPPQQATPSPLPPALEALLAEETTAAAGQSSVRGAELVSGRLTPEAILKHSGELPALPRAAAHIMAVIEDPRTTATSLEKALAMDQALTAKVLRIANSPFYGAVREIRTVSEAIVRLGFVAIRNWTLVTATRSIFLTPGSGMLYRNIWKQSVMSAMASQLVAQAARDREPESVFVGGLMQNIGQLILARSNPELFQEILNESARMERPYHEVERSRLGFDHGELGAMLIREWNLSAELEAAVRWHHRFDHPAAENSRVAAMIALGEEIAACSGAVGDEKPDAVPAVGEASRFLEISATQLSELHEQARELHIDPHFFA
jgi:HD-like signal output (HDOD) protein